MRSSSEWGAANINQVLDFWHSRWEQGRCGWHEAGGNTALRKFWPQLVPGSRVLVPLCGKSTDLLWLAEQGYDVTGVELSEIAARAFFDEAGLLFETEKTDGFNWFRCRDAGIAIATGNYFEFSSAPFDAFYDRASLTALPAKKRCEYVRHTRVLLKSSAARLLLTLEFDETNTEGPPFSILPDEVLGYWPDLQRVEAREDIANSSSKIREAGVNELIEVVWVSPSPI
jgi:thiopurine S-methyltransferase